MSNNNSNKNISYSYKTMGATIELTICDTQRKGIIKRIVDLINSYEKRLTVNSNNSEVIKLINLQGIKKLRFQMKHTL